jgi:hypothetical protein
MNLYRTTDSSFSSKENKRKKGTKNIIKHYKGK